MSKYINNKDYANLACGGNSLWNDAIIRRIFNIWNHPRLVHSSIPEQMSCFQSQVLSTRTGLTVHLICNTSVQHFINIVFTITIFSTGLYFHTNAEITEIMSDIQKSESQISTVILYWLLLLLYRVFSAEPAYVCKTPNTNI